MCGIISIASQTPAINRTWRTTPLASHSVLPQTRFAGC